MINVQIWLQQTISHCSKLKVSANIIAYIYKLNILEIELISLISFTYFCMSYVMFIRSLSLYELLWEITRWAISSIFLNPFNLSTSSSSGPPHPWDRLHSCRTRLLERAGRKIGERVYAEVIRYKRKLENTE